MNRSKSSEPQTGRQVEWASHQGSMQQEGEKRRRRGQRGRRADRGSGSTSPPCAACMPGPGRVVGRDSHTGLRGRAWSGHRHSPSARLLLPDLVTPLPQGSCEWHHHERPPPTLETWVPSLPPALWICLSNVHEAALALHQLWTALCSHAEAPACSPPVPSPSGPAHRPQPRLLAVVPVILLAQERPAAHLSSVASTA